MINVETNLVRQRGPTAACLHFVLLCAGTKDFPVAAANCSDNGRRHPTDTGRTNGHSK